MAKTRRRMKRVRNPDVSNPDGTTQEVKSEVVVKPSQAPLILITGLVTVAAAGAAWWFMIGRHDQSRFGPANQQTATYLENKARDEARLNAAAETAQRRTSTGTPTTGTVTNRPFSTENHLLRDWFTSHFSGFHPAPTAGAAAGSPGFVDINDRDTIEAVQRVLMGLGYRRNGESDCATGDNPYCRITPTGVVDNNMRESLKRFIPVANPTVTGIQSAALTTHLQDPIHPEVFYAVAKYANYNPGYFWTEGADESRVMAMLNKFYTPITAPARGLGDGVRITPQLGEGAYVQTKCGGDQTAIRNIVISGRRKRL